MAAKFVINETKKGFTFNLKATNGEVIATSEVYNSKPSCKKGIASVQKNAELAEIEDQTAKTVEEKKNPKFEIYKDKKGEFRFRLKAGNGQIIAVGQGYADLAACKKGLTSIKKNAAGAAIVEEEK